MSDILVECKNISKTFNSKNTIIKAVNGVNLSIKRGECYGLVGESGCGKSTLSSMICALQKPDSGSVSFAENPDIFKLKSKALKNFRKRCQIIFQDPYSSLNPKQKISQIIEEPLIIHKLCSSKEERMGLVNEIRTLTGLPPDILNKYPDQLSGGQRQRVAIATAMILEPEFVICDESVSALDVLIQAQILNLLKTMQKSLNLTYLFISHNLNVIAYMADRIGVMYKGQIIEENTTEELIKNPQHPYTKTLLAAAGIIDSSQTNTDD